MCVAWEKAPSAGVLPSCLSLDHCGVDLGELQPSPQGKATGDRGYTGHRCGQEEGVEALLTEFITTDWGRPCMWLEPLLPETFCHT